MCKLVILDFDGVVVDSEMIANGVLAEELTALGWPMSTAEAVKTFGGKTLAEEIVMIGDMTCQRLPENYGEMLQAKILAALRRDVRPIEGVADFISNLDGTPYCIGSSSTPERLTVCLEAIGLAKAFSGVVFSASHVGRNKPFPDLFLHAADQMGVAAADTVVVEDSVNGVRAGKAAGMRTIGFTAGSHLSPDHGIKLKEAGAVATAANYQELARLIRQLTMQVVWQ